MTSSYPNETSSYQSATSSYQSATSSHLIMTSSFPNDKSSHANMTSFSLATSSYLNMMLSYINVTSSYTEMKSSSTTSTSSYTNMTSSLTNVTSSYVNVTSSNSILLGDPLMCLTTQEIGVAVNMVAILVGMVISIGNLLILVVLFKFPSKLFTPLNWLICHLAVADLFIGLTVFFWYGVAELLLLPVSSFVKVVMYGLAIVCVLASFQGLMMIAFDRYFLILKQAKYASYVTKRRIKITIILMWIVPLLIQVVAPLAGWSCVQHCDCRIHNVRPDDIYCFGESCSQILPPLSKYQLFSVSVFSLICFTVISIVYSLLFYGIRKHSLRIASVRSSTSAPRTPVTAPPTPRSFDHAPEQWRNKSNRFTLNAEDDDVFIFNHDNENAQTENSVKSETVTSSKVTTSSEITSTSTEIKPSTESATPSTTVQQNYEISKPTRPKHLKLPNVTSHVTSSPNRSPRFRAASRRISTSVIGAVRKVGRLGKRSGNTSRLRDLKVMKSMFIIMTVFVLTTVPLMVFIIYTTVHNDRSLKEIFNYLLQITTLNSLLNPFLYFWKVPAMRNKLRRLMQSIRKKLPAKIRNSPKLASRIRKASESSNSSSL